MLLLAMLPITLAIVAILRGVDVRLSLFLAAMVLGSLAGEPLLIVGKFFQTLSNERFVVPICSAMGFAYVLRQTGCDQELVQLLTRPLRSARWALIPGGVLVTFLVNIPVISQASTAVCVGPVLVPLMRAGGISARTTGASLLLGASIGGELLNPGAPELRTIIESVPGTQTAEVMAYLVPMVAVHLCLTTMLFWWTHRKTSIDTAHGPTVVVQTRQTIGLRRWIRAGVPVLPMTLLFLSGPPLRLLPEAWYTYLCQGLVVDPGSPVPCETRLIGLAMLIGVLAATLVAPGQRQHTAKMFFEGAGYALTHIIGIIVAASCFAQGVKSVGLATYLQEMIQTTPSLLYPFAGMLPCAFGWLSGSGMAATQGLFGFFVPPTLALDQDPLCVGALVSLAAAAGRTVSPVAAVVLMSATLSATTPLTLVRSLAPSVLLSLAVVIGVTMVSLW